MNNTSHSILKKASQDFFAKKTPDDETLKQWLELANADNNTYKKETNAKNRVTNSPNWIAVAASVAVFIGASFALYSGKNALQDQPYLTASEEHISDKFTVRTAQINTSIFGKISDEVIKNHLKMRPLEIQSSDYKALRRFFTSLDFSPTPSNLLSAKPSQLLGARYCSIQSVTAAQLRFKLGSESVTLYQVDYQPTLHGDQPDINKGEQPVSQLKRGLRVSMWVENQILMVAVGSPKTWGSNL